MADSPQNKPAAAKKVPAKSKGNTVSIDINREVTVWFVRSMSSTSPSST